MPLRKIALLSAAASFALGTPAIAQMNMTPGMHMPGMKMPAPKKKAAGKKKTTPARKGNAAKKGAKAKASTTKTPAKKPAPKSHGEHGAEAMPGMDMKPGETMQNMPGMEMPQGQAMPGMQTPPGEMIPHNMPGMAMPGMAPAGTDLPAGNAPPPPLPTDHAADRIYGPQAMAIGRHHLETFHGGQKIGQIFFNLAEYQFQKGRDGIEWNGEAWHGGDINRVWLKSEGEAAVGRSVERAEVQALYSHAIGPYFNLQGGLRYDFKPDPSRVYATIGVEGLAPSFFEVEGALFLSNKGELMARAEGYYDQRITQRLILQPRAELNFAAQSSREIGIGSGLSSAELGLRLRYDITRQFAPYVGVQYRRAFGDTRRFQREADEDSGAWSFVTGIRTWF